MMVKYGLTPLDLATRKRRSAIVSLIKSEQKRIKFFNLMDTYVEYIPYRSIIYLKCYPTDNVKFPEPVIGWVEAYKVLEKSCYDEIFFYLHIYVASKVDSRECSSNRERFASNCNRTYELMDVLTSKLKEYINPSKLLLE